MLSAKRGVLVPGVRILTAIEAGQRAWSEDAGGGRRIAPGGFVKAVFAGEAGSSTEREAKWIHVGKVFQGGQVAGVVVDASKVFPQVDRDVLIVLQPQHILSVLDASTDMVPDLWEGQAPRRVLGDVLEL